MKVITTEQIQLQRARDTNHTLRYFFIKTTSFVVLASFVLASMQYFANYTLSPYLKAEGVPDFSYLYLYFLRSSIVWAILFYALCRFTPDYASVSNKISLKWLAYWLFIFVTFLLVHAIATDAIHTLTRDTEAFKLYQIGDGSVQDFFMFHLGHNIRDSTWITAISCFMYFILSYRREVDLQRIKNTELMLHLNQARMDVLTAQLNPHFLFNALHTVSALTHEQPDKANTVIAQLGEVLRITLSRNDQIFVSLRDEVDFVKEYLAIETVRFGDRLYCEWNIDSASYSKAVPPFLLQPLVENAIKYGVNRSEGKTRLIIASRLQGEHLIIEVSHHTAFPDGKNDSAHGLKIGMKNLTERLDTIYGKDQWLLEQTFEDGHSNTMMLIPEPPGAS
jgi:Histidine kinase